LLARPDLARHMSEAMSTATTTTRPSPKMRIAERAVAVDAGRLLTWLAHTGRLEGLTRMESAFALHLAGQLAATSMSTMTASLEAIAHAMHSAPLPVRRAIDALVERGVLGFTPGYASLPSVFHLALPSRIAASMVTIDEDGPPI
jgi:hypothetical protein